MNKIAYRVQDKQVLHLIKLILKSGGKKGLKQGGVLSPLLSNVYLNEIDKMLERAKNVSQEKGYYQVEYARFADDLIVLVDKFKSHTRLLRFVEKRLRQELEKLDLKINEDKSKFIKLTNHKQCFYFLGFEYRRMITYHGNQGVLLLPKKEVRIHLQRKLKAIFKAKRGRPIKEVAEEINPILRGWVNYFRIGNASRCFGKLEDSLQKKIRRHLYKAKQRKGFGWKRWNREELYRNTGIYHDYRIKYMR